MTILIPLLRRRIMQTDMASLKDAEGLEVVMEKKRKSYL